MGEVGRWDPELFAAFRGAPSGSARRRWLLGELIRINEPLAKTLLAQLVGRDAPKKIAGTLRNRMKVKGAEHLDWDVAMNAARMALAKAMEGFDPRQGKLSYYLKCKIFYELQCEVMNDSMIRVGRGEDAPPMEYVEDDQHLGRLTRGAELEDDDDDGELAELEPVAHRDIKPENVVLEPPPLPVLPVDRRSALDVFLADHCQFVGAARSAASSVRGRFEHVAFARGELAAHEVLMRALTSRGVRPLPVRVPWARSPVRGLAGVRLQNALAPRREEVGLP